MIEEIVLNIILNNKDKGSDLIYVLKPESFINPINRYVFSLLREAYKIGYKNPILFAESIKDSIVKEHCNKILLKKTQIDDDLSLDEYLLQLKSNYKKHQLTQLAQYIQKSIDNNTPEDKILVEISRASNELTLGSSQKALDDISELYLKLEPHLGSIDSVKDMVGLGLNPLTNFIGNCDLGTLVGIAARPSMGKTALALEMAKNLSVDNPNPYGSIFFSLETSWKKLMHRLMSNMSSVPIKRIKTGNLTEEEKKAITSNREKFLNSKLKICSTFSSGIDDIINITRREKLKDSSLTYIFIDYLQLLNNSTSEENVNLTTISRQMRFLANELNIIIFELLQLNRSVESRDDKRPLLSDLRSCGAIEQDLDIAIFPYRDEYYNRNTSKIGITELIIRKNKEGETGTVEIGHQLECGKYSELGDFEI